MVVSGSFGPLLTPLQAAFVLLRCARGVCHQSLENPSRSCRGTVLLKVLCSGQHRPSRASGNHQPLLSFPSTSFGALKMKTQFCVLELFFPSMMRHLLYPVHSHVWPKPLAPCCRSAMQRLIWSSLRLCCCLGGGMFSVQKVLQNPPSLMITFEIKLTLL